MPDVAASYGASFSFVIYKDKQFNITIQMLLKVKEGSLNLLCFFVQFWFTFQVNLCSHNFYDFLKKGSRPKWIIYMHESDKSKKCLSVGNFGILSVVCNVSAAQTNVCRSLKYLLKMLVYPIVAGFLIFGTTFSEQGPFYCVFSVFSYIIDQHSCLKYGIFTKFSHIVCLMNVHILVCQYAKCNCRLWKIFRFDCVFWEFLHITTCQKRYSFIKL